MSPPAGYAAPAGDASATGNTAASLAPGGPDGVDGFNQPNEPTERDEPNGPNEPNLTEKLDGSVLDDDFEQSLRAAVSAATAARKHEDESPSPPSAISPAAAPSAPAAWQPVAPSGRLLDDEIEAEESAAAADGVSFVQHARRQAFWEKWWVRTVLTAVALLLLSTLLLQAVIHQKDHWVLLEPRLKPVVQALCGVLGCELGPLKKIESVVIDSSTFTKLGPDSYKLSFSIKNLGPIAVAMPALEVTLTDTQDQAVVRRVLAPAQFGASTALLAAGVDFQGAVVLDVTAAGLPRSAPTPSRVAGYRLLAFYP